MYKIPRLLSPLTWLCFCLMSFTPAPKKHSTRLAPPAFDLSYYYRLTNNFAGPGKSLDINPNGSGLLQMSASGNFSGQFWKLTSLGNGRYRLSTAYLGEGLALDIINNGTNTTPRVTTTGNFSGQSWTIAPWGDGSFQLSNDFTGPQMFMDTYSGTFNPYMGKGNFSGMHWTLTRLEKIPATTAIPPLNPGGYVYKTEGQTDFSFYKKPQGNVKALMIFVDFPNAPAGNASPAGIANHLTGNGEAGRLLFNQSYKKMNLDITVKSALGWRRMPQPSTSYSFTTFETHRTYIAAAASLFTAAEVNFAEYDMVFVVAPQNAGFALSPAFNAPVGQGVPTRSGEIRLAVTFGTDSYTNRYTNLVHEVGHLFGLPDLYPYSSGGAANAAAGCWPIMCDIFHSLSFLGWHRHKNEWLDADRKTYLAANTSGANYTLSPLSGNYGLSMIVLPIDNSSNPSKVLVMELAEPVLGSNNQYWGSGVLVYTVDARVATGASPVVVLPKIVSTSPDYGYLYQAPFQVNDTKTFTVDNVTVTLSVLQKFSNAYNIKVGYRR